MSNLLGAGFSIDQFIDNVHNFPFDGILIFSIRNELSGFLDVGLSVRLSLLDVRRNQI